MGDPNPKLQRGEMSHPRGNVRAGEISVRRCKHLHLIYIKQCGQLLRITFYSDIQHNIL